MDDKKKLIAVGSLFVAMLAIGAFEFTKGSGDDTPAKPKDAKAAAKTADGSTPVGDAKIGDAKAGDKKADEKAKNPLVSLPLPARDPFKPISLPNPTPSPAAAAAPKPVAAPPKPRHESNRLPSIPPLGIEGTLPPADQPGPNGPISGPVGATSQGAPAVQTFGYKLKGTLMGDRPMAVFADSQGNERIVPVGSSLDGDSQVVSVSAGAVKVRVHGKTRTMTPGGNE